MAEWERKKKAAKLDNKVKMSNSGMLALTSYSIDSVRKQYMANFKSSPSEYRYIREMWNDHMIVSVEKSMSELSESSYKYIKVPYSVDKQGVASFGQEVEVKQAFVPLSNIETRLTDAQLEKALAIPCTEKTNRSLLETVALSQKLKMEEQELMKLSGPILDLALERTAWHYENLK